MLNDKQYNYLVKYISSKTKRNDLCSEFTLLDILHDLIIQNPDFTVDEIKEKIFKKAVLTHWNNVESINPELKVEKYIKRRWKFLSEDQKVKLRLKNKNYYKNNREKRRAKDKKRYHKIKNNPELYKIYNEKRIERKRKQRECPIERKRLNAVSNNRKMNRYRTDPIYRAKIIAKVLLRKKNQERC